MSFLARLAARSRFPGAGTSLAMPKGLVARSPLPLLRQEEEQEDEMAAPMRAATLRRQEQPEEKDEEMQRAASDEEPQEEEAQRTLHRSPRAVRRQAGDEEEEVAPLRRARTEEQPEEEVAPLRRQSQPEEEEELQTARVVRRAEEVPLEDGEKPLRQPFQSDLDPASASPHPDLANEEEPPAMQALRRDALAAPPRGSVAETGRSRDEPHADQATGSRPAVPAALPDFFTRDGGFGAFDISEPSAPHAAGNNARPEVVIEQLDVLIHEPAAPAQPAVSRTDHSRALRARYLRRL